MGRPTAGYKRGIFLFERSILFELQNYFQHLSRVCAGVMAGFITEAVWEIVEDLVLDAVAVHDGRRMEVGEGGNVEGEKEGGSKVGNKVEKVKVGKGSQGGMVCAARFNGGSKAKGKTAEEKLGRPEGYFTVKGWHQY